MRKYNIAYMIFFLTIILFQCSSKVNLLYENKPGRIVAKNDITFKNHRAYYKNEKVPFNGVIRFKFKDFDYEPDFEGNLNESDAIAFEIEFKNGRMNGKCVGYNLSGSAISSIYYYKNGKKNGKYIHFFIEGDNISEEGGYKKDRKHGHWIERDYKGNIIMHKFWNKGKLIKWIKVTVDEKKDNAQEE